jgi:ubiquinone biosynthesis protein
VVDEFDTMMRAAVDLRQELANLQQFTANFADEPDIVIPTPYPDLCGPDMLTMSLVTGQTVTGRDSVIATGWDVDELVRRASDVYLEMVFRDGIYHADPIRGTSCSPTGSTWPSLTLATLAALPERARPRSRTCCSPSVPGTSTS